MNTSNQTLSKSSRFKTYSKSERVIEYYREVVKLNKKAPRIVHHMVLNYEYMLPYCQMKQLKNLDRPLKKLKKVKALFLYLYESKTTNDWILFKISQNLKSLNSLHTLKFKAPYSTWISSDGMHSLAFSLGCLKNLSVLILNFQYCHWKSDENFSILFQGLGKLRFLKSLGINLNSIRNLKEKNFKSLALAFRELKSLEELNLALAHIHLETANILNDLTSGLKHLMSSLTKFQITFTCLKNFTASDIYSFMSLLKDFQHLEFLNLSCFGLNLDVTAFEHLSDSFKYLTKLQTLRLDFSDSQTFSDTGLEMEVLTKNFSSLSSLNDFSLRCGQCQNINDQTMEKLSVGLKTLNKLSKISLAFPNCKQIGDSGFESIIYELGGMSNLKSVVLHFKWMPAY